jgi:hypothetical protein
MTCRCIVDTSEVAAVEHQFAGLTGRHPVRLMTLT